MPLALQLSGCHFCYFLLMSPLRWSKPGPSIWLTFCVSPWFWSLASGLSSSKSNETLSLWPQTVFWRSILSVCWKGLSEKDISTSRTDFDGEQIGTIASCFEKSLGVLDYSPLLQIGPRRKYIIDRSDHECQAEERHSPNVFPCDGFLEDFISYCPLALLALLHCQSDSFRFHLSPSLLKWLLWLVHLLWTISQSGSIRSWRSTWMGPLISPKAKIASDFSILALWISVQLCCGITSWTLLSLELLSDHCVPIWLILYFFNNGPERQPQSCAPTVENDRRYWWWQPQLLPCALIDIPLHFFHRRQSFFYFVYGEWPEQPRQENEL